MTVENSEADPSKVINRFKFMSANVFIIVNPEGIEKKIDIDAGFKEIAYNYRPLFNDIDGVEWEKIHYYVMRSELNTNTVINRLKRMY